ncbi:MAG: ammonium transporter, partial [Frankiaceae bacterium]|nr:ammonium transporter [Frankiaceae bacterium]
GGWFYSHFPNLDYAGGTVVHINAGVAGGILALVIGRRAGWPRNPGKPHNVTLTMLGAGLLWFGWYGFNVGSIVFTPNDKWDAIGGCDGDTTCQLMTQFTHETGVTFMNTTLATMAAMLAWLLVERVLRGKATSLGAASGVVAGLVAITPSCGSVNTLGAICVGAIAGAVCAVAIGLKYKLGLDDSLDVVGVHLTGGIIGALLIGFFGTVKSPQGIDDLFPSGDGGLFYGGNANLLWHQFLGVAFTVVWCGVVTLIIAYLIKVTIGWRVTSDAEVEGIDVNEHGESAYDWGTSAPTGAVASHVGAGASV